MEELITKIYNSIVGIKSNPSNLVEVRNNIIIQAMIIESCETIKNELSKDKDDGASEI